jgi:hypothetical protein
MKGGVRERGSDIGFELMMLRPGSHNLAVLGQGKLGNKRIGRLSLVR